MLLNLLPQIKDSTVASELYFLMLVLMEFRVYAFYSCNKPTVRLDFLFLLT